MALLQAFEAAARRGAITAAASELNLTQSAVSRQIGALEDLLGYPLFHRERQRIRLTAAGEVYAREIRGALDRIAAATLGFRSNPGSGTLNLAILPMFGARWLAPRLPLFQAKHPGIAINLQTRLEQFDFNTDTMDAAIHFGSVHWPGAETALLMHETVIPACSEGLCVKYGFQQPADLARAPLLHLSSRPDAWEEWFRNARAQAAPVGGMLMDQFALTIEAARAGLGIALLPQFFIEKELQSGDLVAAIDRPTTSEGAYFLVWPPNRSDYPPLQAFREWLLGQAEADPTNTEGSRPS